MLFPAIFELVRVASFVLLAIGRAEACLDHGHLEARNAQNPAPKSSSSTSLVVKPNHTGFTVSSIASAVQFWNGVLGLQVLYRYNSTGPPISTLVGIPNANVNIAFVALPGGMQVELLEYPNLEAIGKERKAPARFESGDAGMVHLALDVKPGSLDGILQKSTAIGWKIVNTGGKAVNLIDGRRAVYLRDSRDGFTVELFEG